MGDAARPLFDPTEPIPPQWRELYAELAADWIREHGTLPPSLEELVDWSNLPSDVPLEAEIAYLEGRGPDPSPCSSSD
jgi:hypothetical protein